MEDVAVESESVESESIEGNPAQRRRSVAFLEPVAATTESTMADIHQGLSNLNIKEDKYTLNTNKDIRRQTPGVLEAYRESYII
jgi:hypothetical protein